MIINSNLRGRTILITFVVTLFVMLVTATATTSTGWVQNINKSTHYLTIQEAIDDASPGDVIYTNSGIYYENVDVNKELILKGINTGEGYPVVDGGENGNVITLSAGNITLEEFETIGSGWLNAGIYVNSSDNLIINNNASNNYWGIFLGYLTQNNNLSNNIVFNNRIYGIFLGGSNNNSLMGNRVHDNQWLGFYLGDSSNNMLISNYISNNSWDGIYLDSFSSNNMFNSNDILENIGNGISLWGSSNSNMFSDNNVSNNKGDGITFLGSNSNIFMGNNVSNNNINGISIWGSSVNILTNNDVSNNNENGFYLRGALNNTLNSNNISKNNVSGISLGTDSSTNTLINNNVINNMNFGISISYFSNNNTIYDNYFNNINNYEILDSVNIWNITETNSTNIVSGLYMGGNIWAHPDGSGFSQKCEDNNEDGLCDSAYTFDNNSDYHPVAYLLGQALYPTLSVLTPFILPDQHFKVELIINNNHFETIENVTPSLLIETLEGDASATMISGPVPGSANISGRSSKVYNWTYKASGIGELKLSGSANGVDVVSGNMVDSIKTHDQVPLILRKGGVSISVSPRENTILNCTSIIMNITAKNTQNVDDVFMININVSEIPFLYQADLNWFDWTKQVVYIRVGQEIITPINVTIPNMISGIKIFHIKVSHETSGIYALDTGYLKII